MLIVFRTVRAIHIKELEAIHQRWVFLLRRQIFLASWDGLLEGSSAVIIVPFDLRSFVGTADS